MKNALKLLILHELTSAVLKSLQNNALQNVFLICCKLAFVYHLCNLEENVNRIEIIADCQKANILYSVEHLNQLCVSLE